MSRSCSATRPTSSCWISRWQPGLIRTRLARSSRWRLQALADWLLSEAQQQRAMAHGLRPATGEPDATDTIFSTAEPFGILLEPDYGTPIVPPSRSEAAGLVQWFSTVAR